MTKVLKKLPKKAQPVKYTKAYNSYIKQNLSFWFSDNLEDWHSGYQVSSNRLKHPV